MVQKSIDSFFEKKESRGAGLKNKENGKVDQGTSQKDVLKGKIVLKKKK